MELAEAAMQLQTFAGTSLTQKLSSIEARIKGLGVPGSTAFLNEVGASLHALEAAATIKHLAGQIDVTAPFVIFSQNPANTFRMRNACSGLIF